MTLWLEDGLRPDATLDGVARQVDSALDQRDRQEFLTACRHREALIREVTDYLANYREQGTDPGSWWAVASR